MRSLWRIEKFYEDQATSEEEGEMWQRMREDKLKHIEELKAMLAQTLTEEGM